MKTQAVCIILSALLCSSLAHDFLRAKELSSHLKHHGSAKHHISQSRADTDCPIVCTAPSVIVGLELIINGSLVAVVNTTSNLALVLDLQASIVVLLNGQTGGALAIDLQAQTGVYIASGIWLAASVAIDAYLATLSSLKVILTASGAVSITVSSASSSALHFAATVVQGLIGKVTIQDQDALSLIVALSKSLIISLKVVVRLVDAGAIVVAGGLLELANKLAGIAKILANVTAEGIKISLKVILSGINGVQALIQLLLDLHARIDSAVLNATLTTVEDVVSAIALLGGYSVEGTINGIFTILSSIIDLKNNAITINKFLNIVITVSKSINVTIDINSDLSLLASAGANLTVVATLVQGIANGNLQIGGVSTKSIIASLTATVSNVLSVVVIILVAISAIVGVSTSIVALFTQLIGYLLTNSGKHILVELKLIQDVSVNVISQIASIFNPANILKLLSQGVIGIISSISYISSIYNSLVTVTAAQNIDLKALLNNSTQLLTILKQLIASASSTLAALLGVSGSTSGLLVANQGLAEVSGGVSISAAVSGSISLTAA